MSTISAILYTALMGMQTCQGAIDITSENIAKSDADGYSRKSVRITGIQGAEAVRAVSRFAQKNVVKSSTELGFLEKESSYLTAVEALFDESEGSGLNEALSDFWNSWQDLANNPSGATERSVLVSNSSVLAGQLNDLAAGLEATREAIDEDIASAVSEINQITGQIAELNQTLFEYQASGRSTDSINDSLDYLTGQLAALVDINYYTDSDGQVCIQLANGKPLVEGQNTWSLETSLNTSTGLFDIEWNDGYGTSTAVNDTITGGVLGGCLAVRDKYIPAYLDDLDELASTLITEVNNLLTSGYDLNGQPGVDLFTGTGARDIAVNSNVVDDPSLIAAAGTADSAPGDGSVALAVAELQTTSLMNGGTTTLDEFYSALVSQVGQDTKSAESGYEQQSSLDEFYRNFRESISGVSLDEEYANLVIYQQAYEASARVITLLQELLETAINM